MFSVRQVMVLVCSLFISQTSFAVSLEDQEDALKLIISTVNGICAPVSLEGSRSKFELTGEGKAEIEGLLKKLVDLDIKGATKFQRGQYIGVLQRDLASVLISNTACKSVIFSELQKKLIPNISAPSLNDSPIDPNSSQSFQYPMEVQDRKTGEAIFNAKVTIEVLGNAPINVFTDSNGFTRIFIEEIRAGEPGRITVQADGYETYVQNIDLNSKVLMHVIQLE